MSVATANTAQPKSRIATGGAASASDYRICSRCIMDTSDPLIEFDEHSRCNHCRTYDARATNELLFGDQAESRLREICNRIRVRGKKKDYDCIIGVSGGVDSTAVAYHVHRLGLRPLAVHLDNGWNSELAVDNIKHILQKLDIDLFTHVIDWEEFRDLQLSFLRASVPNCEIPTDHSIGSILVRTARRLGIKHIITGSNLTTEAIMPIAWGHYNQDLKHLRAIHRRFGNRPLKTFPSLSLSGYVYSFLISGVRYIPILNYLDYNKGEAKRLIQEKLGWRDYGGKHFESIYTRFFQAYILPRKFGFDKRRAHLSTLLCAGQLTRAEALQQIQQDPYENGNLELDKEFVVKKLGLTAAEFEKIMSAPPREHLEYPSNNLFFHRLTNAKRLFKRVATKA